MTYGRHWIAIGLLFSFSAMRSHAAATLDPKEVLGRYDRDIKPLMSKHCFQCHGNGKKKGGISLDEAVSIEQIQKNTPLWLSALDQVSTATMPPEESKELQKKDRELLTRWIENAIEVADTLRPKDPGFVALHRLNRTEYNNTIRDLTGIEFNPADDFPADDSGYGFDNIADVLTMSPLLAEKYIGAAEQIVEKIIKQQKGGGSSNAQRLGLANAKLGQDVREGDGLLAFTSNGEATFAVDAIAGTEYVLRVNAWQDAAGTEAARMTVSVDGTSIATINVDVSKDKARDYTARFKAKKNKQSIVIAFVNDFYDEKNKDPKHRDRNLYVGSLELEAQSGPAGKSGDKIFIASPSKDLPEQACAEKIIKNFATRAFRRPVKELEFQPLMKLYEASRKQNPFEIAIGSALTGVLVSPHFLFRVEGKLPFTIPASPDNPTSAWPLDDYEVAVRMSYFLWSTMPDDELTLFANQRALKKASIRDEQVKRMLQDRRSNQLIANFAGQWLELRNLDDIMRDSKLFPGYGTELADYMQREATMFFESVVREDKSILTLIDADYTYINGPLAQLYGIPNIKGKDFQKVSVKNTARGGIITMSSTLTLTANPTRTSPVKRGKWVLEQILGSPPPPPPPEVPTLVEKSADEAGASLRQRLEKHRSDPNCATCHNRMDGLGFALENFDSIGRWRESDGKFPIDAAGTLPGGETFKGPQELKAVVMKRKAAFVRNFVVKMTTYALGRGVKPYDRATINDIVKYVEQNDYKFSSVVSGIVNSDAFLKRRDKRGDE